MFLNHSINRPLFLCFRRTLETCFYWIFTIKKVRDQATEAQQLFINKSNKNNNVFLPRMLWQLFHCRKYLVRKRNLQNIVISTTLISRHTLKLLENNMDL